MKKIVVLNLKMNLDYEEAQDYVKDITNNISDKHEIVICPSFLYLDMFKKTGYKLGAQNAYVLDEGAFTGEISPLQLKTFGVSYVIIGHSERRNHFHEDDKLINLKVKSCLRHNLKVILCIGETSEERRLNKTALVLKKQILSDLDGLDANEIRDVIIAYEPVWAIGSGLTPTDEEIADAIKYIEKVINEEYNLIPRVIYGGSINESNVVNIMNIANIDGVLVGGSSINPKTALEMLDKID